jgi:hypothetical protein
MMKIVANNFDAMIEYKKTNQMMWSMNSVRIPRTIPLKDIIQKCCEKILNIESNK